MPRRSPSCAVGSIRGFAKPAIRGTSGIDGDVRQRHARVCREKKKGDKNREETERNIAQMKAWRRKESSALAPLFHPFPYICPPIGFDRCQVASDETFEASDGIGVAVGRVSVQSRAL